VKAGVLPKSTTTIGSGELHDKWLSLHIACIESLGGCACDVCNKLRALCTTHPIITFRGSHNKVVVSLQSFLLCANTYAMERKLGMATRLQNDRIRSFLPLTWCEKPVSQRTHWMFEIGVQLPRVLRGVQICTSGEGGCRHHK